MIVVSDASPMNVLVRIGHVGVLPELFHHVLVPPAVVAERSHVRTPIEVRTWIATAPAWLETRAPTQVDPTLDFDDPGESEAISLAVELRADLLLVDDRKARRAAVQRGLATTGLIGVLELAAARGLVDMRNAFVRLRTTDFRISERILNDTLARDAARRRK